MNVKIIQDRLGSYKCMSVKEEELALREITQEVALAALSRADFYKAAVFHGGTCLRVFYSLNRFSEDLDFMLKKPDARFMLDAYLKDMAVEFEAYGYKLEVTDRSRADNAVKKAFLKDDSIGKVLQLSHLKADRSARKIKIKIEVDTNPPAGSTFESKFLDFPFAFSVTVQDQSSLFAGKVCALLCREYTKGRDWYDFIWYTSRKTPINFDFLAAALKQTGPWRDQAVVVDNTWCIEQLKQKIRSVDWDKVRADVRPFIDPRELDSLALWGREFFLDRLENYSNG
ncbi:MAG: nucleotidyl transferase AbiEii/AbiGii toxin family protein [Candidatus Omnitrophica bacterium]|nr:nucleotidyl transferase AbiEii/AbiGii toxin family protein [Candidatus Omnitrophota bacterium]